MLRLAPKLAVDYLKAKGYNITWNWQEQLEEAHVKAFTVAKVTRADILETIREATVSAIENGTSEREFIKNLKPELQRLSWWGKQIVIDSKGNAEQVQLDSPRRLRTILRTNKITAYHVGRYAHQMENVDEQPYWQYVAVRDSRTRASHLALHCKMYRYDDPIWDTMYPPNDWGYRCRVRALSEFRLKQQGLKVSKSEGNIKTDWELAGVDKSTGEETHAKVSRFTTDKGTIKTGPGWNYNVGKSAVGSDIAIIRKLQQIQNRQLRQEVIQAINNSELRHQYFEKWVKENLGKQGASNRYITAGFVSENIAQAVNQIVGQELSQRVLVMSEKRLAHANSLKHHTGGVRLDDNEYASISRIIATPSLVVWDRKGSLIYFNKDKTIKVLVDVSGKEKLKPKEKLDVVINAYKLLNYKSVLAEISGENYKVLEGEP
ncbi:SPP1 gp7 family putative phage head morphogenesis protein [Bisgaardia hudsonensis]|uniref:SPP1 gp7 family putative phage head morphogenesis protein n=1 Tax=Bisgaardia hudsonensis TaxID=109472 RepID=A0A4V2SJA3_9PAST|nr:phage minor head protein [Bisgaardia hudsonensis]QLB12430.1 phage head morphogenesis protein [Bisgaardia hudsonensis]TCP13960.1 SPP1 gp7 family putative phage head morphogenesis protein [Bisgaardia hudsonensis]